MYNGLLGILHHYKKEKNYIYHSSRSSTQLFQENTAGQSSPEKVDLRHRLMSEPAGQQPCCLLTPGAYGQHFGAIF